MKTHRRIAAIAIAAAAPSFGFAASAHAGGCTEDPQAIVAHIFDVSDVDGDGALTAEEYEEAGLERYGVGFDETDADGDGKTTKAEYLALYERYHPPVEEETI